MRSALTALAFFFGVITITPSVVAIIVALIGPVGAYLIAARRFSGKIETTEARDLWAESASIREWSRRRIEALEAENARLRQEMRQLRAELRGKVDS